MSQYFPKPYENDSGNVKIELDLSSYATNLEEATGLANITEELTDLEEVTGVDTSTLAANLEEATVLTNLTEELTDLEEVTGLTNLTEELTELEEVTGVDTSNLAAKSDLASLKFEVDQIDKDKIKTFCTDLSKVSNVVKNDIVKKKLRMIN